MWTAAGPAAGPARSVMASRARSWITMKPCAPRCARPVTSHAIRARWNARSTACIRLASGRNIQSVNFQSATRKYIKPPSGGLIFQLEFGSLGGSSNGRTTDSDSVYLGSNPSPPAKKQNGPLCVGRFVFRVGTRIRTLGFDQRCTGTNKCRETTAWMQEVEQRREQLPRQETESGRRRSEGEILRFTESRSTERACHGRGGRSERAGGPFARRAGSPWMANSGLSS